MLQAVEGVCNQIEARNLYALRSCCLTLTRFFPTGTQETTLAEILSAPTEEMFRFPLLTFQFLCLKVLNRFLVSIPWDGLAAAHL